MDKYLRYLCGMFFLFIEVACFKETPVKVVADFEIEVTDENYSVPVTIRVVNKSIGADLCQWFFEGGEPRQSNKLSPGEVVFSDPGKYTLRLEAWNTTERAMKEVVVELDSVLSSVFGGEVAMNHFSPVEVLFHNYSQGGVRYVWEFEGGEPASFEGREAPVVVFREPGLHVVRLQVFGVHQTMECRDTVRVLPALAVDFSWTPEKDNPDLEAPLTIELAADCSSALSYRWRAEGGRIENDTLSATRVVFDKPGVYSVELCAANGKEEKRVCREVVVREGRNLYCIRDLKFGVTTALSVVGGYFSSTSGRVLTVPELTPDNGGSVDLVFWGLPGFEQCCFLSPDSVALKALPDVPDAAHSWVVNRPDGFSVALFDGMEDDGVLQGMAIRESCDQGVKFCFSGDDFPHCVLFETRDHCKGAIKIKKEVEAGRDSYIVADVKVQRRSR